MIEDLTPHFSIYQSTMYIMKTYASRHFHHDARLDIIFYLFKASNHLIHRLAHSFNTQCLRKNGLDYVRWYASTVYKPWDLTGWWCWTECMFATFPKLDRIGIEPIPACSQQIGTGEFFEMKGHLFTLETFCNKQFFWTTKRRHYKTKDTPTPRHQTVVHRTSQFCTSDMHEACRCPGVWTYPSSFA